MKTLHGITGWESEPTTVSSAILRNNDTEIAIDFESDGYKYTAVLKQSSLGYYSGSFTRAAGEERYDGSATARLFHIEDGYLLFGKWREENSSFTWWVELNYED